METKDRLMKYAGLYIKDEASNENMIVKEYVNLHNVSFGYHEVADWNRIDGTLTIFENGEVKATFTANIGR